MIHLKRLLTGAGITASVIGVILILVALGPKIVGGVILGACALTIFYVIGCRVLE